MNTMWGKKSKKTTITNKKINLQLHQVEKHLFLLSSSNPIQTPEMRLLWLSPLQHYTSKGVSVSQGYTLPVWCYASQVTVWVTSPFFFWRLFFSFTQHFFFFFFFTREVSKVLLDSTSRGIDDTWPLSLLVTWQPSQNSLTWRSCWTKESGWLPSCFLSTQKMKDESTGDGKRVILRLRGKRPKGNDKEQRA